jgi:hypothetical protein
VSAQRLAKEARRIAVRAQLLDAPRPSTCRLGLELSERP